MIDPETNALLLLYDDVQSIYSRRRAFSWASVGVQAKGRTTILKINYRNTVQLLQFAYRFVQEYLEEVKADEEIPVVAPNCAGRQGPLPRVVACAGNADEVEKIADWLRERHRSGVPYGEMAVLYRVRYQGERVKAGLEKLGFEIDWLTENHRSRDLSPALHKVKLVTMHSSKGLEFNSVAIAEVSSLPYRDSPPAQEAKLLYVAMTRATEALLLTGARKGRFFEQLLAAQSAAA
ncbi:3'-5' exonuclease [Crenobacter cavernae]|uniref:3'-5' exonuclease n=1 Tax=Crenobacter cavernae TaxID=2290923 RepID=UPI00196AE08F|nr:3'-5' exonuclease [Crenobacter cavernae]